MTAPYSFTAWPETEQQVRLLALLPLRVPGVKLWPEPVVRIRGQEKIVVVPGDAVVGRTFDHGVGVASEALDSWGVPHEWAAGPTPWWERAGPLDGVGRGRLLLAEAAGLLTPGVTEENRPWQLEGVGFFHLRRRGFFHWSTGAGKTRAALEAAVTVAAGWMKIGKPPPRVLIVAPVAATYTWLEEAQGVPGANPGDPPVKSPVLNYPVFLWKPVSRRRKKDRWADITSYVRDLEASWPSRPGPPPVVIVGLENIQGALGELLAYGPQVLVWDEVHELVDHSRWTYDEDDDGNARYEKKENLAAAAMDLARSDTIQAALGLTATAVPDRVRGVYAAWDLVEPQGLGRYWDFAKRFCGAFKNGFGGWDDKGRTNFPELLHRMSFIRHLVTKEEVSQGLPGATRQVIRLPVSELTAPTAGWKTELKGLIKQGAEGQFEAQVLLTSSRKRKWGLDRIYKLLKEGQKVVVFLGRRRDVEDLGLSLEKTPPTGPDGMETFHAWTHGEFDVADRQELIHRYMAAGTGVLIGTGDSIGQSVNLQDTDELLNLHLPWEPLKIVQREGRAAGRLGQKRHVRIVYVVAERTVDERIATVLLDKLPASVEAMGDEDTSKLVPMLKGLEDRVALMASLISDIVTETDEWTLEDD